LEAEDLTLEQTLEIIEKDPKSKGAAKKLPSKKATPKRKPSAKKPAAKKTTK